MFGLSNVTTSTSKPESVAATTINSNNALDDFDIFMGNAKPAPSQPQLQNNSNNNKLNGLLQQTPQKQQQINNNTNNNHSFFIYDKNNLKIKFSLERKEDTKTFILMNALNMHQSFQITDFKLETSVPKTFQIQFSRLNSTTIQSNDTLSQVIQITNPLKVIYIIFLISNMFQTFLFFLKGTA